MPPNAKPTIFIASSGEGKAILEKTAAFLKRSEWDVRPWNETGIFTPTLGTLEELERQAHEVDFAVIIVTPDDICESRDKVSFSPRDNVMIELGLFVGSLERKRAFLLTSVDPDLKLASDLHGATILYFNDDAQLDARLGEIEKAIQRIGRVYRLCKVVG
jgi:predicted nucleotide-binding protein